MDLSILITTRNSDRYINRCLDSIFNQNFDKEYEVIIVDCNSDDLTLDILKNYEENKKIKVISTNTNNLAEGANKGLAECTGSFIVKIDPCYMLDDKTLNEMFNFLSENSDYDVCSACVNVKHILNNYYNNHTNMDIDYDYLIKLNSNLFYCYMFKNLDIAYDELYSDIEDYKLLLDLSTNRNIRCIGHNYIKYMNTNYIEINANITKMLELKRKFRKPLFVKNNK